MFGFFPRLKRPLHARSPIELIEEAEASSVAKFEAIESVLRWPDEISSLESEPGYDLSIRNALLSSRRRIALIWLRELKAEFDRLYEAAHLILLDSERDHPDLVLALWKLKQEFYVTYAGCAVRVLFGLSRARRAQRLLLGFEQLIGYVRVASG